MSDNESLKQKAINYNGWMDEPDYRIRHQLMFEAERELLKKLPHDYGDLVFYTILGETVAGIRKEYNVVLRLSTETPPSLSVTTKDRKYVGMFYLRDPEVPHSNQTASEVRDKIMKRNKDLLEGLSSESRKVHSSAPKTIEEES